MKSSCYPYHPRPVAMFLSTLLVLGATLFMGYSALTNDRGLILNGLLHFDPGGATVFYWLITLIIFGGFVFLSRSLFVTVLSSPTLEVTDGYISAPPTAASRNNVVVKFSEIQRLRLFEHRGYRFLDLEYGDNTLRIRERFLPDQATFESVFNAISQGIDRRV